LSACEIEQGLYTGNIVDATEGRKERKKERERTVFCLLGHFIVRPENVKVAIAFSFLDSAKSSEHTRTVVLTPKRVSLTDDTPQFPLD
jgi:hypothetical protein